MDGLNNWQRSFFRLPKTNHFSGDQADIRRQTAIHALRRAVQLLDQAQDQQPAVV